MIGDTLHAAFYAVTTNRLRTALTAASVAVGICSVVFMASLARSGLITLGSELEAMGGARLVGVFPKRAEGPLARYATGLTVDDVQALRGRLPHVRWLSVQTVLGRQEVTAGGREATADVVAGDAQAASLLGARAVVGRLLVPPDEEARVRVAVLAGELAASLFPSPAMALKQPLRIGAEVYTVVGVLEKGMRLALELGYDAKKLVLIPQTRGRVVPDRILVGTVAKEHNPTVVAALRRIIGARHRHADDFRVFDFAVAMERFQTLLHLFELVAGAIAGVALLAGAAGTTNVLMVSMHEQVREIGVRKALGATAGMITRQFLLQGMLLAALGALGGVAIGLLALYPAGALATRWHDGWVTVVAVRPTLLALVCAFAITAVASLVPAMRAKRMSIVDSLRARG